MAIQWIHFQKHQTAAINMASRWAIYYDSRNILQRNTYSFQSKYSSIAKHSSSNFFAFSRTDSQVLFKELDMNDSIHCMLTLGCALSRCSRPAIRHNIRRQSRQTRIHVTAHVCNHSQRLQQPSYDAPSIKHKRTHTHKLSYHL